MTLPWLKVFGVASDEELRYLFASVIFPWQLGLDESREVGLAERKIRMV